MSSWTQLQRADPGDVGQLQLCLSVLSKSDLGLKDWRSFSGDLEQLDTPGWPAAVEIAVSKTRF